ncbi:MAG: sulfite exporter TauE/SafE family protein [Candidatus Parabeggiatoa sp. nov. 1]|nr:MAG: sulfite exporter TauE/SafE family protein [Gammaproteobacteria bacterium]
MNDIQLLIFLILFLSTLVRSTFGFGDAVVAMPLLSMIVGIHIATPLVALISLTISTIILIQNWHLIHFKSAKLLIFYTFIGIPIGLFMLKGQFDNVMKLTLASVIILFSVYQLAKPKLFRLVNDKWISLFGISAGILGGAYNTEGPIIVIYSALRQWEPIQFRATLQGYFFPVALMIALAHGLGGLWTQPVLFYYAWSLPFVFMAIFLGGKLHRKIPTGQFDKYIYICLIILGVILFINTLTH